MKTDETTERAGAADLDATATPLPPPGRGDVFGTLERTSRNATRRGPGRPPKGLQQLNLRLVPGVRAAFKTAEQRAAARYGLSTANDFMELLLVVFDEHGGDAVRPPPVQPSKQDAQAGRTALLQGCWVDPKVSDIIHQRAATTKRTTGAVIHDMLMRAAEQAKLERRVQELEKQLAKYAQAKA